MSRAPSKKSGAERAETKPRLLGPATTAMLLGLVIFGGWNSLVPPKVTIERRVASSGTVHRERTVPLSQLLSWSVDLNLSDAQRQSLAKLSREQVARLAPVVGETDTAVKEFNEFAERHNQVGISLAGLQARGTRISALSARKRGIEEEFARAGLASLTAQQQEKARALWQGKRGQPHSRKREVASP